MPCSMLIIPLTEHDKDHTSTIKDVVHRRQGQQPQNGRHEDDHRALRIPNRRSTCVLPVQITQ